MNTFTEGVRADDLQYTDYFLTTCCLCGALVWDYAQDLHRASHGGGDL